MRGPEKPEGSPPVVHGDGIRITTVGVPRHTCALLIGLLASDCDCKGCCTGRYQMIGADYYSPGRSPLPDEW
jgi:hypothetical protein